MSTKLSFTKVTTYKECPRKYKLRYIDKMYPKDVKSSLTFGKCIDEGLNNLLLERNLEKALDTFKAAWTEYQTQPVKYTKSDLDEDLILDNQIEPNRPWLSLLYKGNMIIKAFNDQILPRIKKTILVQEVISAHNDNGDEINGALDAVIVWEDDKTYLIDNKTTSVKYTPESANESEQLALYHFIKKDELKLDGVAFFTLNKILKKTTIKTCQKCDKSYKSSPAKYCQTCQGDLTKTFEFKVETNVIFGKPSQAVEEKTLALFDEVNAEIKKEVFKPDFKSCVNKFGRCDYYEYCKYGRDDNLVKKVDNV